MSAYARMARHELGRLLRERTYLLMVLVQLLMVCSALFFAVGYSVIFSSLAGSPRVFPERALTVAFYTTDYFNIVQRVLSQRRELNVRVVESEAEALAAVRDGTAIGAVIVGPEFRRQFQAGGRMRVFWVTEPGNLLGAYATRAVAEAVGEYGRSIGRDRAADRGLTYDPLIIGELVNATHTRPMTLYPGPEPAPGGVMQGAFEITYTLVIPLLLLFSLMVATSVVMDGITEEMETGTLDDLLAAPVGARAVVLAKTLPIAGLTVAQVLLWTAVLRFQGIAVHNLGLLFAYLALVLLFFTGLGVVTASLARTRRSSHALYGIFLLGFVYLTFVGGPLALYSPANLIAAIVSNPVVPGAVWGRVAASGLVALAVYLAGFAAFGRAVEG